MRLAESRAACAILALAAFVAACDGAETIRLDALKRYVLDYQPCGKPDEECAYLPDTPKDVATVLNRHPHDEAYRVYVTLMLLKFCRAQLENYHVNFEIRHRVFLYFFMYDPMLRAFSSFSGVRFHGEFVQAYVVYDWVLTQPEMRGHRLIAPEIRRIETEMENIEKGVYWGGDGAADSDPKSEAPK